MTNELQNPISCQTAVICRFLCDECGWIGTRDDARREFDFGYDQSCCPKCGNVMFDNLHGNDYAEKVVEEQGLNEPLSQPPTQWRFLAFKNQDDYSERKPYFEEVFNDYNELKAFSARHSFIEKALYPEYVIRVEFIKSLKN